MAVSDLPPISQVVHWEANIDRYARDMKTLQGLDAMVAKGREQGLAKAIKDQNELNRATAKALDTIGLTGVKIDKSFGQGGAAVEAFTKKIGNVGKQLGGMLAGFSIGMGVSAVTSIFSKIFEPPSDEDLAQFVELGNAAERTGYDFGGLSEALKQYALDEQKARAETKLHKAALEGVAKTVENITHAGEIKQLQAQIQEMYKTMGATGQVETGKQAIKEWSDQILRLQSPSFWKDVDESNAAKKARAESGGVAGLFGIDFDVLEADAQRAARAAKVGKKAAEDALAARRDAMRTAELLFGKPMSGEAAAWNKEQSGRAIDSANAERERARKDEIRAIEENAQELRANSIAKLEAAAQQQAVDKRDEGETYLESLFGKPDEFAMYSEAFNGLANAAGAAFDALISGSGSSMAAFRKALGGELKAIAVHAGVQAIIETAWALGSLARYDYGGYMKHRASAAKWAVGALAAGVGAAALGGGGGGGSSGGATGNAPSTPGSGGNDQGGQRGTVIVINDPYSDDSPRMRQLKAEKWVGMAGLGASDDSPRPG